MLTLFVSLQVRPDQIDRFLVAIEANAAASLRDEPGCVRFDVHRVADDPCRFLLYEIYRDEKAFYQDHRATPHYAAWREVAAECIEEGGHVNTFAVPVFPQTLPEMQEARS